MNSMLLNNRCRIVTIVLLLMMGCHSGEERTNIKSEPLVYVTQDGINVAIYGVEKFIYKSSKRRNNKWRTELVGTDDFIMVIDDSRFFINYKCYGEVSEGNDITFKKGSVFVGGCARSTVPYTGDIRYVFHPKIWTTVPMNGCLLKLNYTSNFTLVRPLFGSSYVLIENNKILVNKHGDIFINGELMGSCLTLSVEEDFGEISLVPLR